MKLKQTIILFLMMFFVAEGYSQSQKALYYFVVKKDTVFCKDLKYGINMQGDLVQLHYTDMTGKKMIIEGKKEVPDVSTFYMVGLFVDKTPLKADKPDGHIRYTKRAVDGKLKVYLANQGTSMSNEVMGSYRFFLRMPDDKYYQINDKKNMKDVIKPYLLKCKEFTDAYTGDFNTYEDYFMEMIRLYNALCP